MKNAKQIINFLKTGVLYAKVGLKGMTPRRGYNMARYWFKTNVLGQSIPWLIELSVTYNCQCKCPHCSVGEYLDEANKKQKDELSNEQIKSILAQAAIIGIPKVDFFGGEPLLRAGIVDLVKFGAEKGLYMSITTNAGFLTKEMTKELKRAGISCLNISLDSALEQKHDSLRGVPGLYKKALAGAEYCHNEGIPCIMSTYVTRNRIKNFGSGRSDDSQLAQIISLSKKIKATGLRILFPIISGRWEKGKELEFTEAEKKLVMDNLDYSFAFIEGAYSIKNGKKTCQSLAGKMFNISPYGDVQLCVTFPQSFGNVKNAPLADILKAMYNHPIYLKNKGRNTCSADGLEC